MAQQLTRAEALANRHSAEKPEWGTVGTTCRAIERILGGPIDTDPASSAYWNHHVVKARTYYDERTDGLAHRWRGRVLVNPPGSKTGQLVKNFWEHLIVDYMAGLTLGACWVGFNLEQLTYLQGFATHPLQWLTLIPQGRQNYLERPKMRRPDLDKPGKPPVFVEIAGPPVENDQPTHGSYLTLIPVKGNPDLARAQVARFLEVADDLTGTLHGTVTQPLIRK